MGLSQLLKRSIVYYWRTNLAVVLGVATAIAVLAGALLVGDSVRSSLRNLVVQRLGKTSYVISTNSFVREQLAADLQNDPQFTPAGFSATCPLITLNGTATHEPSKRVASGLKVYGVDDRFWAFNQRHTAAPQDRNVLVSPSLARELGASSGDSIVLQVETHSEIPLETLHSKKEGLGETLRLKVGDVVSAADLGEFSIQPQQTGVRAIFVSLRFLQKEIQQPDKVNLILVSEDSKGSTSPNAAVLTKLLRDRATLSDLGIKVRKLTGDNQSITSLENDSKIIDGPLEDAAVEAATNVGLQHIGVLSYLANSINANGHSIPYSLVTAIDDPRFKELDTRFTDSISRTPPIILNEWAASDLGVKPGDEITIEYYLWQTGGRLETKAETFHLAEVVPISGATADQNLVPEYPGITGSENLADWDPPFPVDLKRIRPKDEDYWHKYRTTPKAFISLSLGQSLWQTRFGRLTSLRLSPGTDESISKFDEQLRSRLNPLLSGVNVIPVASEGLQASRGATDFGEYFLYFSFFLVVSALLLTTLFFRLGIEQRVREIGVLRAMGFGPGAIRKLFLAEASILALIGSVIGLIGAVAYGQLIVFGLRTWWVGAVGTAALELDITMRSLLIGVIGGIFAALLCVALTLRSLRNASTRSLLAGVTTVSSSMSTGRRPLLVAILLTLIGVSLLLATLLHLVGQVAGFFGCGLLLLVSFLFYQSSWLRRRPKRVLSGIGFWPVVRVGFRNASHRPGRSILCIALIASATFIIVSVDSFRHREGANNAERKSGTGGFFLFAESLLPLVQDPSTREGQEELNLFSENPESLLKGVSLTRFRVQPGDDASCLNLYRPNKPKIIAPTDDFLKSGRFQFQSSMPGTAEEASNPWLLLNRKFPDGAVPFIADANSLAYVLHLKLGDDLVLQNEDQPVRLRVVASLSDSLFQSELIISESYFIQLFPEQQGYKFFLIDFADVNRAPQVAAELEDRLSDFGFDAQSTAERLASFHRVENTYLSTFQTLGGLGLVLGTIGLAAVLVRNVLERRRELALMRAVGYNSQHFTLMIIGENALLLFAGLVTGILCAVIAIAPVFLTRHGQVSTISLGLLLLAVLVSGLIASVLATWATLRTPLLSALKAE